MRTPTAATLLVCLTVLIAEAFSQELFSCPNGWELRGLNCYKYFGIKHSWEKAAELCRRYGSELVAIDSYSENNMTLSIASSADPNKRLSDKYWLGLASLDDLRTNTLESASGGLVSQYSGFWSLNQPNPSSGECVAVSLAGMMQSWGLDTCESLLPFMCKSAACPQNSLHCSNGGCVNQAFKCDGNDDCGDGTDELDCPANCNFHMQSGGDVIESPNYPHKYAPLSKCKWTLEGPQGSNIVLQFQEFETEKTFDTVQILVGGRTEDKSVSLATLSGKEDLANKPFVTASNFMIGKFTSDGSVERKGFRATWKTEPQNCGGTLRATAQGQILTSPGYQKQYPGGLECLYIIQAQPGRIISLEVQDLDLNTGRDYVLIRDGDSPMSRGIARLTGLAKDNVKVIISTGNKLYVYFKTSLGDSRKGFNIRYTQGCKATITALNGTVSSPAFGLGDYPSNQECMYKIQNPSKGPLSLRLNKFNVHQSDVVQLFDGSSTSGLRLHSGDGFTGDKAPRLTLTASSGEMLIKFVTDALHNSAGWSATFSADCPDLKPGSGALASSRDTAFGTMITFTCPVGQEFATGKNKIQTVCMKGGNWSVDYIPKCQEVYCGPVPQIDNGFSIGSSNVTYRGIAMYQCYVGFAFPTNAPIEKISCLSDGRWERQPSCMASQCIPLPDVPHANVTLLNGGGRSYGKIVRFECAPGYERTGHPVLICMSNGTWSDDVPKCTRKQCHRFPEIKNGFIVDQTRPYFFGDEARVQCYKGYKLSGPNIIRCSTEQEFDNTPTCDDINECGSSQCDAASTDCMNTAGSFYCQFKKGFNPTTECRPVGDLGLANGGIPDDSITVSSTEAGYQKGMVRLNSVGWCGNSVEPGSNWVLIDFKAPTVIRGFRTMSVQRYDGNVAFTSAVRLQYSDNLADVFKDYANPDGTAVEFRILEPTLSILNLPIPIEARYVRFRIQDYVGAPCMRMEAMGCTRLDCVDINECAKSNGGCDQKCLNSAGSYSCSCNTGFELFASNGTAGYFIERSETGDRDGDTIQKNKSCVPVMCPALTVPENGKLFTSKAKHHFGDLVRFQCSFGFVMSGSSSLLCLSSGQWNATVPECMYAKCVSLPDDKSKGLAVIRPDQESVLVPFRDNVTLTCSSPGRQLRDTATSGFRQCVYDPKPGYPDYWLSGSQPLCPRVDCGVPMPTPGAEYGQNADTKFQSSFFFGCQHTFKLAGQTGKHDNVVRCQGNGIWDFGDLRCEGPVCEDPSRPSDGIQISRSYEQGSEVLFSCSRPGYILINPRPISCIREPECKVIKPLGLSSGLIPDSAINATSERPNYEARNIRLNSVTGWCGKEEAFTYVSVDLGQVHRVKAILVKGVVTNDIVGRPTEIRFFYKQSESENYVVYFPNFNLTMRDPGNYGELAMITLPKYVQARFVILGIVQYMDNACLKFELMGCEEPAQEPLLGYDYGYSPCVDNEPPVFQNCPQQPIVVRRDENGGVMPVNFTEPTALDNSGSIARLEVKPQNFKTPMYLFQDTVVKYVAFDYDGNVAICEINITVPDVTPPLLSCPQSYVIELVDKQESYSVNFNETRKRIKVSDDSGDVKLTFIPDRATIPIGTFENVTVVATDRFNNKAMCHFQVSVQATPCVDWELQPPVNGALNCLPGDSGVQCIATCKPGYRFTDGDPVKTFSCKTSRLWKPTSVVPDCVSENTQQADYQVTVTMNYRANGAVAQACLGQYQDLLQQYYGNLNQLLSQRCSAVNVNMNVSFIKSIPILLEENVVKMEFILVIIPAVRQPQLYDLCGSTLNLIFDLSVPYASAVIEPLLNVSSIGNQCPPLRALKSSISRGFTCSVGEVLNMDTNDVPRCLHCPAGTFAGDKQKSCTYCPRGFYQSRDRQGSRLRCPPGTYTKEEGSKAISACVPVCGYGTYSPTGLVPCLECPRNSYTGEPPTGGFKDCQACPAGTFTFQPSAPGKDRCRSKCIPGFYSKTGLAPCSACPQNFYQSVAGMNACSECPTNMKTDGQSAAGREECKPIVCTETSCQHGGLCVPMGHNIQCFCPAGFSGRRCEIDIDECASQPCFNGGQCTDLPQGYRCQCPPGYSGINCQEEMSDCRNDTCPARAMCKDEPGFNNYTCLCRSGYTGIDCDITIDPCTASGNPCSNGATCIALQQGRYKCECISGWEGQHCEKNINDCAENPCLLGSNCTDLVNDFSCGCPPGFTGKRCQEKIDLCLSEPCKHGTCVDRLFNYECVCHPGWTGESCDIDIMDCAHNPCENSGSCLDLVDGYTCNCEPGYTGKNCQHAIDDCESEPCQNGATCIDQLDGFSCKCRPGYVGLQCEAEIDECLLDPCSPVGTKSCIDLDNRFECMCLEGFTGKMCETDIDDCAYSPCLNSGQCRDRVGSFECLCPQGWTGDRCEKEVQTCTLQKPCQNDATCIDLFEDYFCVCPSGTDGKQCETAPERCIGNPCMHGGKCRDFGSGLNCSCPEDYSGIGCQYEFDACDAGICQNGAECVDNGVGYTCICPKGFAGKNCEEDITDCKDNSCPPGATCIDLAAGFYCQCPFNLTGDDCRKTIQVNYDLYFSDATRSTAAQVVPFYTAKSSSITIAMWVQFSQKDDSGIFFTLYSVESANIPNKRRPLIQAHSSGVQVSIFPDLQDAFLSFKEYATVNDGQWHHIAIVWDGKIGQLMLITEGLIASKAEFGGGRSFPEFAWAVLGKPQPEKLNGLTTSAVAYSEAGFQGKITKTQIWGRALDVTSELQKQVRDCRSEPVLYRGLLLNWAGYEVTSGGVERSVPSSCGQKKCPAGYSGAQCQQIEVDKEAPHVEHCPGDLWVIARNGSAIVTWDEPHFSDNVGVVKVIERNGHRSGQTLLWGTYEITYIASDAAGNSATCNFKVSLLSEFCPPLAEPLGGTQVCKDWGAGGQFKVCEISCHSGLRFSEEVPEFYTCGAEGFWRPTSDPSQPLVYPSCSPAKPAQRVFRIKMLFPSDVLCNEAGQGVLRQRVKNAVNSLNRDWNFCSYSTEGSRECKDVQIDINCDHYRGGNGNRAKRQSEQTSEDGGAYVLEAQIPVEKFSVSAVPEGWILRLEDGSLLCYWPAVNPGLKIRSLYQPKEGDKCSYYKCRILRNGAKFSTYKEAREAEMDAQNFTSVIEESTNGTMDFDVSEVNMDDENAVKDNFQFDISDFIPYIESDPIEGNDSFEYNKTILKGGLYYSKPKIIFDVEDLSDVHADYNAKFNSSEANFLTSTVLSDDFTQCSSQFSNYSEISLKISKIDEKVTSFVESIQKDLLELKEALRRQMKDTPQKEMNWASKSNKVATNTSLAVQKNNPSNEEFVHYLEEAALEELSNEINAINEVPNVPHADEEFQSAEVHYVNASDMPNLNETFVKTSAEVLEFSSGVLNNQSPNILNVEILDVPVLCTQKAPSNVIIQEELKDVDASNNPNEKPLEKPVNLEFPVKSINNYERNEDFLEETAHEEALIEDLAPLDGEEEIKYMNRTILRVFDKDFFLKYVTWKPEKGRLNVKNSRLLFCWQESYRRAFGGHNDCEAKFKSHFRRVKSAKRASIKSLQQRNEIEVKRYKNNAPNVDVDVVGLSSRARQGRQQNGDTYTLEIAFPAVNDPVLHSSTGERSDVRTLLQKLILEDDQFAVQDILPNTVPDPASLLLSSEYACPIGQVVMVPDCVPCAVGTYYSASNKTCNHCPRGTYQSETGQQQCTKCPVITGRMGVTAGPGARSAADCKERCPAGKYLDPDTGLCQPCGHGFYQPNEGSFSCELCGLGQTTRSSEATSRQECRDECSSGKQLGPDGRCEPCPSGTFRTQGVQPACTSCPIGRTTPKMGSSSIEECSLPVCAPGTYLNGTKNMCIECKKGFYQSESQQTSCIPCPPNHSTKTVAATSLSECTNPCETINEGQAHCDVNAYCILVPETSDFKCECKPGFNGTGMECKDVCDKFCDNSGLCVKDLKGTPSCRCAGSFTGPKCSERSEFAYIAGGIAGAVIFIIIIVLLVWMICVRSNKKKDPKKMLSPAVDQTGSQVNFYYGAHTTPYAESIAPSHHSTYAHYYDDEEDGWEMPNFYNETYMKEGLHGGKVNTLARSNASLYGTKDDLYDRLKRHAYIGKKEKSDSDSEGQ